MRQQLKYLLILLLIPCFVFSQTVERNINAPFWEFKKIGDKVWLPASMPGTVHTDLLNAKRISDPFKGNNEADLQWIENEDWAYQATFDISKEEMKQKHIELQFEGLDTYAEVYVNDSLVLTADNMFRTWNVEVKGVVHKGENRIFIVFESAVKKGKELAKQLPYTLPGDEKVFTRKAQYQYGWDFGPRYVTCGIWKPIKLIFWNYAKTLNVQFIQKSLTDTLAVLQFISEVKCDSAGNYSLTALQFRPEQLTDSPIGRIEQTNYLLPGINKIAVEVKIKNPKRWWCNGLGEPSLYPFAILFSKGDELLDTKSLSIGLRTLELVQEKDNIGKSFYFKLNGLPVFMKGANYIPPDDFLSDVAKENYEEVVQNAVDANMNMLRVWGGGVYADKRFYNECDRKGILVWQDFMFACAMYPADSSFINNVSAEIKEQVIRLRTHPCLALWCGNNEIDEGWKNWGWQKQYKYSANDSAKIWGDYQNLFNKVIPDIVKTNDSKRAYWESTPSIGWGHKESLLQGDSHYWGVWWGMEPFENYKQKVGRFMSEYGFQGMPELSTLKRMGVLNASYDTLSTTDNNPPPSYNYPNIHINDYKRVNSLQGQYYKLSFNVDSTVLFAHQKHPKGFETITEYMQQDYFVPKKLEDYAYVSQLLQADGLKTAIEAHRRAKPKCMGTLFWQLNDCWPGITWSAIDYYGNRKASYYQAKRSYENILISIAEENNKYNVYIINDELKDRKGILDLKIIDNTGKILWFKTIDIAVISSPSLVYYSFDKKEVESFNLNEVVLSATLNIEEQTKTYQTVYYFGKPKDFVLTKPKFTLTLIDNDKIEISTDVIARGVFLDYQSGAFNDNYFDLLPNEKKIITIIAGQKLDQINEWNLPVKSFYDTYEK